MKKFITLSLLCLCAALGFSQKVKLKKGDIVIDDVIWMKYQDCGMSDDTCSLLNLNSEELIFMKFIQRSSEPQVFNRYGEQNYYEISFLGLNKKIEIREFTDDIIKIIFNSKVINDDGVLDEDKVDRLVEKYGSTFSAQSKSVQVTNQTIIIKEEPRRSGVNINIGR